MPVPDTLNARIALAKGWTWHEKIVGRGWVRYGHVKDGADFSTRIPSETHWLSPQSEPAVLFDWVGTLRGVAELMRELNEHARERAQYWMWGHEASPLWSHDKGYFCGKMNRATSEGQYLKGFLSPIDRPGDCVGKAYLSVFGKESDD